MAGSSRSRRAAVRSEADLEDEPTGSKRGPPEEEEEEEEEEVHVTKKKRSANSEGGAKLLAGIPAIQEKRPGSLVKIHLENFMCRKCPFKVGGFARPSIANPMFKHRTPSVGDHTRQLGSTFESILECLDTTEFEHPDARTRLNRPNINFIVGENGSGKSAILTALTVCFGTTAKQTNRASSLKEFIKHGCNYALVSVTLRNEGPEAYEPERYGDSITVERKIMQSGAPFTLYNVARQKVSPSTLWSGCKTGTSHARPRHGTSCE
eukprot:1189357-Prorocentrum_minimum.AAC.2